MGTNGKSIVTTIECAANLRIVKPGVRPGRKAGQELERASAGGQQDPVHDMDNAVAGANIGADDTKIRCRERLPRRGIERFIY